MMKRPVGRPPKPRTKFFSVTLSPDILSRSEIGLAARLPSATAQIIKDLALVSASFQLMTTLQKEADLTGKGSGRRANVHVGMLYAECALVNQRHSGLCADKALRSLGGWEEDSRGEEPHLVPEVLQYAKAILEGTGMRVVGSHRQQLRNGLKYLGINPLFHAMNS